MTARYFSLSESQIDMSMLASFQTFAGWNTYFCIDSHWSNDALTLGLVWYTLICQKCGKPTRYCADSDAYYDEYDRPPDKVELRRCRSCIQKQKDREQEHTRTP
jgi:hypothetical protein